MTQNLVTLQKVVMEIAAKHRLLAILQLLNEHLGYMSNTDLLQDCLHKIGFGVGRDTLMADVDRLASKGLVESRRVEDVVVATLTNRGQEVAKGISTADDVAKPPPGAR